MKIRLSIFFSVLSLILVAAAADTPVDSRR